MRNSCTVALLRPPETGLIAHGKRLMLEQTEQGAGEDADDLYDPYLDEWIDGYREQMMEIAEEAKVSLRIHEYQLHDASGIPGRKRRRLLVESDVLAMIDPTWEAWALLAGYLHVSPHHRGLLTFTSTEHLEDSFETMSRMRTPCFIVQEATQRGVLQTLAQEYTQGMLPRCFAFPYREEEYMRNAVRNALLYPTGVKPIPIPPPAPPEQGAAS